MAEALPVVPLSTIQKAIAARMAAAVREIPHFRLVADIEADELLQAKRRLQEGRTEDRVSLTALLVKASALSLLDVPMMNIQWADDGIRRFTTADVSVVTAMEGGLSTPIVRGAECKSVVSISREIAELSARASRNALRVEEIAGGTFTISNLGMYQVTQFDAIINAPQCAILAVGAAIPKVCVGEQGEPKVSTMMRLTLSVDHRAIDGVRAATFMSALGRHLRTPALWCRADIPVGL